MPKKIDLRQGTAEWLEWRQHHLGGSDAASVLFLDVYRDRYRLFQEKLGKVSPRAPYWDGSSEETAAERGLRLEPQIRNAYCADEGLFAPPAVLENSREGEEFMSASLDGLADDRIIEIKAPSEARVFLMAKEGTIPEAYFCQIQHNLHVSEQQRCDYICAFKNERIVIPVAYHPGFVKELVAEEKLFWSWVTDQIYPFPDPLVEVDLATDAEALASVQDLLSYMRMEEELAEKKLVTLAKLKRRLAEAGSATGLGLRMRWERRRGPIQFMQIPEVYEMLRGVDLEQYRGAESLLLRLNRS